MLQKTFRLKLRKLLVKSFKKGRGGVFNWGGFPSFITQNFFMKMLTKDEVRLQVGMRLQLGILRYINQRKRNQNIQAFFSCSLETMKIENLYITCEL